MVIRSGLVFLAEKNGFFKCDVRVSEGKISEIGENLKVEQGDEIVEAEGRYVLPGFIDAHCHIGIGEEGIGWEGSDYNEMTTPITPALRAIDAINPRNISFTEALRGGVTTVCTGPGSANVVGGQFATISLHGEIIDKMIIDPYAAMKCAFGENPKRVYGQGAKKSPMTRMATAGLLRKLLQDSRNYLAKKEVAEISGENFPLDLEFEAMIPVLEKKVPLKAHAHRADDICTAIRIAKEFDVLLTLEHCTEGHLIADFIKESGYPAVVGPTFGARSKVELQEKSYTTPAVLTEAGVKVAIMTDHHVIPQYALVMCAALAHKGGLEEIDAIKTITSNPAEILGIAHRKGAIKIGLDGDISIWDRHPFDLQAKTERVFICGKDVI